MAEPAESRPAWARRIRNERVARRWSQAEAVRALRAHADVALPGNETLLRNWKRWEAGDAEPDGFHAALIAKTFGTVTAALFPREAPALVAVTEGLDTLDVIARLRASEVSPSTLDALQVTADRLCSAYPYTSAYELREEGRRWLGRLTQLLDQRLTLQQHREILTLAGWVALLVGCTEYDLGDRQGSEATRVAALSLGQEAGHDEIVGWAHEMRAWFALTQGDYRGVIAASEAGQAAAPNKSVAVQLAGQKAKAWARVGDRRQVEVALDQGRTLLESLPYPSNLDNHFVVDPAKFDFYAMDCYRLLGEDQLAQNQADNVIEAGTDFDGSERSPMRIAEARLTLATIAARAGSPDTAVDQGLAALNGERKSLPQLLMVSRELSRLLIRLYPGSVQATSYSDHIARLGAVA